MKICFKCNAEHPLEDFHKHKGMKDGRLNKCKHCVLREVDAWRLKNPEARKKEHARVRERQGHMTRQEYFAKLAKNKVGRKATSLKYAYKRRRLAEKTFQTEFDEFVFRFI